MNEASWRLVTVAGMDVYAVENERVVGLVTAGNAGELLALEAVGRQTAPAVMGTAGGTSQ